MTKYHLCKLLSISRSEFLLEMSTEGRISFNKEYSIYILNVKLQVVFVSIESEWSNPPRCIDIWQKIYWL